MLDKKKVCHRQYLIDFLLSHAPQPLVTLTIKLSLSSFPTSAYFAAGSCRIEQINDLLIIIFQNLHLYILYGSSF